MWSPFDIKMILHFHTTTDRFPNSHAPIYPERLKALMDLGLVEYRDGIPKTTGLGEGFVDLLMKTPVPVVKYVDPRIE